MKTLAIVSALSMAVFSVACGGSTPEAEAPEAAEAAEEAAPAEEEAAPMEDEAAPLEEEAAEEAPLDEAAPADEAGEAPAAE